MQGISALGIGCNPYTLGLRADWTAPSGLPCPATRAGPDVRCPLRDSGCCRGPATAVWGGHPPCAPGVGHSHPGRVAVATARARGRRLLARAGKPWSPGPGRTLPQSPCDLLDLGPSPTAGLPPSQARTVWGEAHNWIVI
jgi:hypothetical protein